jgi:tetratricopeptide (TPR) repeat protein
MLKTLLKFLLARFRQGIGARRIQRKLSAGIAQLGSGDHAAARRSLEAVLELDPRNAAACFHLGTLIAQTEKYPECASYFARALEIEPRRAAWWVALGELARRHADHARALEYFGMGVSIDADMAHAQRSLGQQLRLLGRPGEAIRHLRRAYELAPEAPGTLRDLVSCLIEFDMCEKALAVATQAAAENPSSFEALYCRGFACQKLHQPERALESYESANRVHSGDAELHDARGSTLQEMGRLDAAIAAFEAALALRPDFPLALFHRGLARLLLQDFEHGWQDYEMRRTARGATLPPNAPRWHGESLAGRSLLLRMEQGLGDEIMFASMLPELIATAGHCFVECDPRLRALFGRSFPAATVFGAIPDRSLPYPISRHRFDFETDMGSLPLVLRRDIVKFPRHDGYLKADPARVARWRERLAQLGPGLKVGISWTGGVRKTRRALRSIDLSQWLPVLSTPDAQYVSLQYTPEAASEAAQMHARHGIRIQHWPEAIADYDETAALVCALDLVVSVCTSVVHLGGALGVPVWVMAPYSPEWRYGFRGESMPWYPSARLFRAPAYGEWQPVIAAVAQALRSRTAKQS